jgi:hypothetical protein
VAIAFFSNNTVYDIEVRDGHGNAHQASFFIEHNIVQVAFDGRMLTVAAGNESPEIAAQRLLAGHLGMGSLREAKAKSPDLPARATSRTSRKHNADLKPGTAQLGSAIPTPLRAED